MAKPKFKLKNSKSKVELASGRCRHCQNPFEYLQRLVRCRTGPGEKDFAERRVVRTVCDDCRKGRKNWATQRSRGPRAMGVNAVPGEFTSRTLVAKKLGMSPGQVEELERKALLKVRSSPELRDAYDNFKDEGMPSVAELLAQFKRKPGDRLLEHQLELMEFWQVWDRLRAEGLAVTSMESREVLREIESCHRLIKRELRKG